MNKVVLIGRMTKDVDLRYTNGAQGQTAIARFSLAVDRRGQNKETDFISCIAFGKTAENIQKYFAKGVKIAVSGRIQTGSYTKQDGTKVYTTDVVAEEFDFCEKNAAQEQAQNAAQNTAQYTSTAQPQYAPQYAYPPQANNYPPQYAQAPQMPQNAPQAPQQMELMNNGFMSVPEGVEGAGLPFN